MLSTECTQNVVGEFAAMRNTWNSNSIVATDKSTLTNWYASAIIGPGGVKCHMTSKLLEKTLKILCLELAMRGNSWKNNTIVATDKSTIGVYTKWHPSAISSYLWWLRELCSLLRKLGVML